VLFLLVCLGACLLLEVCLWEFLFLSWRSGFEFLWDDGDEEAELGEGDEELEDGDLDDDLERDRVRLDLRPLFELSSLLLLW
jgi:hypothetical protein